MMQQVLIIIAMKALKVGMVLNCCGLVSSITDKSNQQ